MREIRQSGSAGGEVQINEPSLPLSGIAEEYNLSLDHHGTGLPNTRDACFEEQSIGGC